MRRFNINNIINTNTKEAKETQEAGFMRRHTREQLRPGIAAESRTKLGFVGLSAGAGATTLAFAAAEYLTALLKKRALVTLLELDPGTGAPAGWPYDKTGIDRRFAGRDFVSLYRLAAEGKPLQGVLNIDGGSGFALRVPWENGPGASVPALLRLMNNVAGDVIVCDISAHRFSGDSFLTLLADFDRIICVFDPLPSHLLASVHAAEVCRAAEASGVKTTYVFNKLNPGVNLREATRFTGVRDYIPFPAIPAEAVYAAEYACRSLASEPEIKAAFDKLFL